MRAFRRPSIAVLVLLDLWPTLALGQATKAGVVSTLQGTVTASRAAAPQPIPLKFKDDVFLLDRIQTGDQSVARILLGGKALVTVRERSVLTVTEIPGRSTVNLESGKISLAVARERMSAGESVDIRTANAVAAVRGTVVVAEVTRATAQATPGPPQIVSNFYVLRDPTNRGIEITQTAIRRGSPPRRRRSRPRFRSPSQSPNPNSPTPPPLHKARRCPRPAAPPLRWRHRRHRRPRHPSWCRALP